jgi:hypothetical protein
MVMVMIECNLCGWQTQDDNMHGKSRHEEWHSKARVQKRNTTNGVVSWQVL